MSPELLPKTEENIGDSVPYMAHENLPNPSKTEDDGENKLSIEPAKTIVELELKIEQQSPPKQNLYMMLRS